MLIEEKSEFKNKTPTDFFWFLHQKGVVDRSIFTILQNRGNDMMVESEICFSRYWLEKELCDLIGKDPSFVWKAFQKERLEACPSSSVMSAYHHYLNRRICQKVFPEKMGTELDGFFREQIFKASKMEFSSIETPPPPNRLDLPRFFSHPDPKILSVSPTTSQPYFHRHRVFTFLYAASTEFKELGAFQKRMIRCRKDILFNPFSLFYPLSVQNTLSQFKHWTDTRTNR